MPMRMLAVLSILALGTAASRAAEDSAASTILKQVPLGTPDRWDYLTFDPSSGSLFVAHGNVIDVVDGRSGVLRGHVEIPGANGVALVPALGRGYAGSSSKKQVLVFDLKTFKVTGSVPAGADTDGVLYDARSGRVFVMLGDPKQAVVVDTHTGRALSPIKLDGKPEFAAVDGEGHLFVNIVDKSEVQKIDTMTGRSLDIWRLPDCERPHGMGIDPAMQRLFVGCVNERLLVLDAGTGRIVAQLPIGKGSDAVSFDAKRQLVYSSNGEGTLSVIRQSSPERYVSLGSPATQPSARTMALDPDSGHVFLVAADRVVVDAAADDPRKKYAIVPGSVHLLFVDVEVR
jgi:DNA-binding beta-propeller fold protein YncE